MIKQAVIIKHEDKPIMVLPITTFQSAEDYVKFEQECNNNIQELKQSKENSRLELALAVMDLKNQIDDLKVEIKYLKGEITEEEYTKLIGEGE